MTFQDFYKVWVSGRLLRDEFRYNVTVDLGTDNHGITLAKLTINDEVSELFAVHSDPFEYDWSAVHGLFTKSLEQN